MHSSRGMGEIPSPPHLGTSYLEIRASLSKESPHSNYKEELDSRIFK